MQFIPRIGDEVLVSFVNNDPDQPVVIGSVYNSKNKPPYPEVNSSQSGIKTQLGKLANEIRFDDKTDKEQLYFHAAKDHVIEVENNFTQTVTAEFSSTTEKAIAIIGKDDYSLSVTKTLSETAKEISIKADDKITLAVGGNSIEISSSGITISCDKLTIKSSGDIAASGANVKISSTADTKISAGANLKGSATAKVSLAGTAGTEISSTAQVKISGTAGAELSSTALTKISSSGITQISGSLVQVN
jgi:type VI secretion system secreted protein VgrG